MPSFAVGETDTRFLDMTPYLLPLADPISGVSAVLITMRDGTPVPVGGPAILQAPEAAAPFAIPPWIDTTGYVVSFWVDSGIVPGNYRLDIIVTTSAGRTISRYALVSVLDSIG